MLLGVMLLYVGAVLIVNGIWLWGAARVADAAAAPAAAGAPAGESRAATVAVDDPTLLQPREVSILNIFTGFVGIAVAVTQIVQGNANKDLATIRGGAFILLFAFTYLWVAANGFLNLDGRAFGWYCLFVALTAIAAGIYTFRAAHGNDASIWLGIDWFAWAVLWGLFFVLLTLKAPISRLTGLVAVLEGIATSWVFGFLLLQGDVKF